MTEKQQVPSAGPDFVTKLPQDECRDECCGEIGAGNRALKHALSETPMQSDQIVQLAQAIRLLAFHVDTKIIHQFLEGHEKKKKVHSFLSGILQFLHVCLIAKILFYWLSHSCLE